MVAALADQIGELARFAAYLEPQREGQFARLAGAAESLRVANLDRVAAIALAGERQRELAVDLLELRAAQFAVVVVAAGVECDRAFLIAGEVQQQAPTELDLGLRLLR